MQQVAHNMTMGEWSFLTMQRRERLGGLLKCYEREAA
jgi:hypothetical protein